MLHSLFSLVLGSFFRIVLPYISEAHMYLFSINMKIPKAHA
jgi:hypothetical protein